MRTNILIGLTTLFVSAVVFNSCTEQKSQRVFNSLECNDSFQKQYKGQNLNFCFHRFIANGDTISLYCSRYNDSLFCTIRPGDTIFPLLSLKAKEGDEHYINLPDNGFQPLITKVEKVEVKDNDTLFYLYQVVQPTSAIDVTIGESTIKPATHLSRRIILSCNKGIIDIKKMESPGLQIAYFPY